MPQSPLFPPAVERSLRALPVIGEQRDITYYAARARGILNDPAATGMGFWSINPYIGCAFGCAYCYARYAHRYVMERAASADRLAGAAERDAGRIPPWLAFERHIFVKRNGAELLARTLRYGSERHLALVRGEHIAIGTATDPYQPAERRYRVTREILEVLAQHPGLRVSVTTKSPLITRDVDVLVRIARHSTVTVHLSLITLDRALARRLEPRAPTPASRLRALARLREAGINAGINVMPVLPGITDHPRDLEALVRRVAEAGALHIAVCALRLRHEARKRYLPFIAEEFPELAARYRRTYAGAYAPGERYRAGLSAFMKQLCRKYGIPLPTRTDEEETGEADVPNGSVSERAVQLSLPLSRPA